MPNTTLVLRVDTKELQADLERLEKGELSFPTVSAIEIIVDGNRIAQMPVYLQSEGEML